MAEIGDRVAELGRARIRVGYRQDWDLVVDFGAIAEAIEISTRAEKVTHVVGPYVHEETQAYTSQLRRYVEYSSVIVDDRGSTIFSLMKPYYKGRSRTLSRIRSHLSGRVDSGLVDMHSLDDRSRAAKQISLARGELIDGYVSSRKIKTDADLEMAEFLDLWSTVDFSGPVVLQMHGPMISLAQYLIIEKWSRKVAFVPLVISTFAHAGWQKPGLTVPRQPYMISEMFDLLSLATGKHKHDLRKTWAFWSASQSNYRAIGTTELVSVRDADKFANFLRTFEEETPELDEVEASIPSRIVAPIMFREADTFIDIDHRAVVSTNLHHIVGGARALRNQVQEVMATCAVENSVPGAVATFARLATVLDRIQTEKKAEEADIVELGVEFSFLESKIFDAADRIGVLSKGPILGLLGEISRYLSRFEAWRTYREETAGDPETQASLGVGEAALQLLRDAVRDGLLSPEASQRVQSATEDDDALISASKREGAARSTESMGAALGRSALKIGRRSIEELGDEVRKRAVEQLADGSEAFLKKNASSFMQIATARGGRWLAMVLQFLSEQ